MGWFCKKWYIKATRVELKNTVRLNVIGSNMTAIKIMVKVRRVRTFCAFIFEYFIDGLTPVYWSRFSKHEN